MLKRFIIYALFISSFALVSLSLFIDPFKIKEDDLVVVDADVVGFLEMLHILIFTISATVLIAIIKSDLMKFRTTFYLLALLLLTFSIFQLGRLFLYFEPLIE